jgi:hypothetical protein
MICPSTLLNHRLFFMVLVAATAAPIVSAQSPGWYLGLLGQSCNDVCTAASVSLSCTAESLTQQQLVTRDTLGNVATEFGSSCATYGTGVGSEDPSRYPSGLCFEGHSTSNCETAFSNAGRFCYCSAEPTKETCPGEFIPVLGLFMKLLCLLFKFITSPFR